MKRDSLFFEFFRDLPRGFFEAIGRGDVDPEQYELKSIEYKQTAVRLDGVFSPLAAGAGPAYIWETQWYSSDKVYANLMSKIGRFLEHGNPAQMWVAVVIYPTRSMEKNLDPYRCLLNSDQLIRLYLDEFAPAEPDRIEMNILHMIAAEPDDALRNARELVTRVRSAELPTEFRRRVIQFVETVILYQFPTMSREEIERMLQVTDVRQTRVFQEALQEGREEGRMEGREEGRLEGREEGREEGRDQATLEIATKLLLKDWPVAEIVEATGLTAARVRALKKKL